MTPGGRWGGPALVAATLAWGSTIVTIKVAARGVPVPTIAVIEVMAALVVLVAVLARRRQLPRRPPLALLVGGLLEPGLAYPLLNSGLARTSGTHGSLIIGLESVIVVLLGAVSERRAPSRRTLVALALAAAGAASLVGGTRGAATVSGDLLVAAGVGCAAGYVALVRRFAVAWDPVELTAYQFAAGSLAILPIAAVSLAAGSGAVLGHATGWEVASAVTAGVVGSAVAFLLYNWALGRVPTALAGTSLTLIPVFGVAFAVVLLDEALTGRTVVAACAVLAGVALACSGAPAMSHRATSSRRRPWRLGRPSRCEERASTGLAGEGHDGPEPGEHGSRPSGTRKPPPRRAPSMCHCQGPAPSRRPPRTLMILRAINPMADPKLVAVSRRRP